MVFLKEIAGKLHALEQQDGFDLVVTLLNYVLNQVESSQHEAFVELVQQEFSTQVGEKVMTTGEYLREQGRQQGLQEAMTTGEYLREQGRHEGEAALLMRQLLRKFRNIPKNYHDRIECADSETLLTWGERILEAETLEAIFAA